MGEERFVEMLEIQYNMAVLCQCAVSPGNHVGGPVSDGPSLTASVEYLPEFSEERIRW